TRQQLPQQIATFITDNVDSVILFLLLLNIVLHISGMLMEGVAAITVTAPLIYPAAVELGADPVHLGIIMNMNHAIGKYTPPIVINIFVAQSITKLDIKEMMPGISKFLMVNIAALLLITYIPDVSLFLLKIVE